MDKPLIWAEVDLKAIAHNVRALRQITDSSARLMAVVKADGYGHGAVEVAAQALRHGAEILGVARINEAIELRKAGLDAPILIFGYTPAEFAPSLWEYNLIQTVYTDPTAQALSARAVAAGQRITVHLKIDTGMGRLGLLPEALGARSLVECATDRPVPVVESIMRLAGLEVEGIFTHFAASDSADKSYAAKQLEIFLDFLDQLRRAGIEPPIRHAANSAALIEMPESHLEMVRPGIAIYGLYPSDQVNRDRVDLKPAMTLKSRIIHLKRVPAGFNVSYGMTYVAPKKTTIATVPVGYADGFNRLLSSRGHMLVHGHKVPIVGRVCMDLTMLDLGNMAGVELEDEVVMLGRQGDAQISADEIASRLNTINYEVVSTLTARVPRIYPK